MRPFTLLLTRHRSDLATVTLYADSLADAKERAVELAKAGDVLWDGDGVFEIEVSVVGEEKSA